MINWPQQNYDNGVSKNSRTGKRFKAVVRILKRLRCEMSEARLGIAPSIPSFLIECLVWNVPDEGFGHETYTADVRYALAHIFNEALAVSACREWGEINGLKYLFWKAQPWTMDQAKRFTDEAWQYIGFR